MTLLMVCPLSRLESVFRASGAEDVVTLMTLRQRELPALAAKRHLRIVLSDITEARDGFVLPDPEHLRELLRFAEDWDRRRPLLIHCYAGVSRSTAAAFFLACALRPDIAEERFAAALRIASPTATPNARIIALGDALLSRSGRMVRAITAIGRGVECFEGVPFEFSIGP